MIMTPTVMETRLRVMGSDAHLIVHGGDVTLVDRGSARLRHLERRWSRFIADSEISRLNRSVGAPLDVSDETVRLVESAIVAWRATGGAFDPTVHDAVVGLGYDRTFGAIGGAGARTEWLLDRGTVSGGPAPGCDQIAVDAVGGTVTLPAGIHFDPGGIGKGMAADIVAVELMAAGANGAMVNVGGDLRCTGTGPHGGSWLVEAAQTGDGADPVRLEVHDAGIATSTTLRRRWSTGSDEVHHLVDPATGRPMRSGVVTVTTIAGEAWWAEVATKPLMLHGTGGLPVSVAARLIGADGSDIRLGGFERFVR